MKSRMQAGVGLYIAALVNTSPTTLSSVANDAPTNCSTISGPVNFWWLMVQFEVWQLVLGAVLTLKLIIFTDSKALCTGLAEHLIMAFVFV